MSNPMVDVDEPDHPIARGWLSRIRTGEKAIFTLFRKRDGLTFKPAKISLAFQPPREEEPEQDDWDVDINAELVREGVRAETAANEAQRLALMMSYWFSKPEEHFGPGFFEGILIEVAQGAEIAQERALRDVLDRIRVTPSARDNRSYALCKEAVETILRENAARSLVRDLKYSEEEAKGIVAEALGRYLDERFHVTERRMLGWS